MSANEVWRDMFSSLPDVWKVAPILDSVCSMTSVANAKMIRFASWQRTVHSFQDVVILKYQNLSERKS